MYILNISFFLMLCKTLKLANYRIRGTKWKIRHDDYKENKRKKKKELSRKKDRRVIHFRGSVNHAHHNS